MKQHLDLFLNDYQENGRYPFHMPGHKRHSLDIGDPYRIDITEIEGSDSLHHASGILLDAQQRAAELYGSEKSFYLINGSTGGILAAISACVNRGGRLLMARNSHKAVYHAAYINQLKTTYLYPEINEYGIQGAIRPEAVEQELDKYKDINAVIVTSPTYEGVLSDIKKIAESCHRRNIPLIVDGAHGAHLGLSRSTPESALQCGADLVINSLHKTLPSLTQTALLHVNTRLADSDRIQFFLSIYQSSSPSYVLMSSMEKCIRFLMEKKESYFVHQELRLKEFYQGMKQLRNLRVLTADSFEKEACFSFDDSKISVLTVGTNITSIELETAIREQFHIEPEMTTGNSVLFLTSILDTDEGFHQLKNALLTIDQGLSVKNDLCDQTDLQKALYIKKTKKLEFSKALDKQSRFVDIHDAVDQVCGQFIALYPPGIPMILPGEIIEQKFASQLEKGLSLGLHFEGISNKGNLIKIVNF
ncbi:MAG: aminotransferase class I/II-fold pyridoxal phosphate-dependent enzyme [Lachnospiraceae bacterium]